MRWISLAVLVLAGCGGEPDFSGTTWSDHNGIQFTVANCGEVQAGGGQTCTGSGSADDSARDIFCQSLDLSLSRLPLVSTDDANAYAVELRSGDCDLRYERCWLSKGEDHLTCVCDHALGPCDVGNFDRL